MYDFIILTAAITRPELHSRILPSILEFIDGVPVKWLIHVDDIGHGASVAATVDNFRRLFVGADNIDAEFLYAGDKGCFFKATKRLALRAEALLPHCRTGVFWLEDDWALTRQAASARWLNQYRVRRSTDSAGKPLQPCPGNLREKQALIESRGYDEAAWWYVSLVPKAKAAFNPALWSKSLFREAFYERLARMADGRIDDPEELCCKPLNEAAPSRRRVVFVDPLFHDLGRNWIVAQALKKWQKDADALSTQGVASYSKNARAAATVQRSFTGFYLLSDAAGRLPLTLLVQSAYHDGKLTARLPGVPWLSFELLIAEDLSVDIYIHRLHAWAEKSAFTKAAATLGWQHDPASGLLKGFTIASKLGGFSGSYSKTRPLCALWRVPVQSLLGLGLYLFTLGRLLRGLKY